MTHMDLIRIQVSEEVDSIERYAEILKAIGDTRSPVRFRPLYFPETRPKTVVLTIGFSFGPSGFRANFPLASIKKVLRPLFEAGLKKIIYLIDSYDPIHDLEGLDVFSSDALNKLQDLCDEAFMDCEQDISLTLGNWLFPYDVYDPYYTELTEELLDRLDVVSDANGFLKCISGIYYYRWMDSSLSRHPSFQDSMVYLENKLSKCARNAYGGIVHGVFFEA